MSNVKQGAAKNKTDEIYERLGNIVEKVKKDGRSAAPAHQVELGLFKDLLAIGLMLMELFFESFGNGDLGETVELEDGRKLRRILKNKLRKYRSVFGVLVIKRTVYGVRAKQKQEYVHLDSKLQLPENKDSYLLQSWQAHLCSEMSFKKGSAFLEMLIGHKSSSHTQSREIASFVRSASSFEAETPPSPRAADKEIIVSTADGKGVPMRYGKKRMALIGSSYAIAPYTRTKEQILIALFSKEGVNPEQDKLLSMAPAAVNSRPEPVAKIVRGSLSRDEKGRMAPSNREIFDWLASDYQQRDPNGEHPHVMLADGQKMLWDEAKKRFGEDGEYVEILDIIHVAEYVWEAANILQENREYQRFTAWFMMREILSGRVAGAIHIIELIEENMELTCGDETRLDKVKTYLKNNAQRMKYDQYLAAGYPIASGVIEGACRHVVKDRMELSGMRWTPEGAQNILELRCISINGQWENYMEFHIDNETNRLHTPLANNDNIKQLQMVA